MLLSLGVMIRYTSWRSHNCNERESVSVLCNFCRSTFPRSQKKYIFFFEYNDDFHKKPNVATHFAHIHKHVVSLLSRENINCILHRSQAVSRAHWHFSWVEKWAGYVTKTQQKLYFSATLFFLQSTLESIQLDCSIFSNSFFSSLWLVGKNYTTFGVSENSAWTTFVNKNRVAQGQREKVVRVRGIRRYSPQLDGNGSSVNAIHNSSPFASSKKNLTLISLFIWTFNLTFYFLFQLEFEMLRIHSYAAVQSKVNSTFNFYPILHTLNANELLSQKKIFFFTLTRGKVVCINSLFWLFTRKIPLN